MILGHMQYNLFGISLNIKNKKPSITVHTKMGKKH